MTSLTSLRPRDVRAHQTVPPEKPLLRFPDVMTLTTLSCTGIKRLIASGDFPKPFRLGKRVWAWRRAEIEAWLAGRPGA
jgi:prophage regulatory protein